MVRITAAKATTSSPQRKPSAPHPSERLLRPTPAKAGVQVPPVPAGLARRLAACDLPATYPQPASFNSQSCCRTPHKRVRFPCLSFAVIQFAIKITSALRCPVPHPQGVIRRIHTFQVRYRTNHGYKRCWRGKLIQFDGEIAGGWRIYDFT